jgi:uncharacterized cupredoxin-like copper-binding protein
MKPRQIVSLLAASALLLSACGGGGSGGATTTAATSPETTVAGMEITVTATEFVFDPDTLEVPAGVPVTITLINRGVVEHDFTIEELGIDVLAQPGETVSETFTFEAGEYHILCSIPGHHEAGMLGTLTVTG